MAFSLASRTFGFGDADNNYDSIKFFTGKSSVKLYLRLNVDTDLTPVRYLKSLDQLALKITSEFSEPSGNYVTEAFAERAIAFLNKEYSFVKKYYGDQYPTFIFLDQCHIDWNSVCVTTKNIFNETFFYIFLYHLKKDVTYSPEYVFLHELGHVVQTRLGSSDSAPQSFYRFLNEDSHFIKMTKEEQKELFADGFASTALIDMGLQELDPFSSKLYEKLADYYHETI